jgi:hypothetical protein
MSKKTHAALAGIILFILTCSNAGGEVLIGTKKGISLSSIYSMDSMGGLERGLMLGFNGGIFTEIPLSRRFSLEAELLFAQRGMRETEDGYGYSWVATYFDIPLLTKINLTFLRGLLRTSLFLGPQLCFGIGSEFHEDEATGGGGPGEEPDLNPFDLGFTIGVEGGVRIAGAYYLLLDVRYVLGLLPLVPPEDAQGQYPRSSMFSILAGFGFPLL